MREDLRFIRNATICGLAAFFLYIGTVVLPGFMPGNAAGTVEEYLTAVGTAKNGPIMMLGYFLFAAFGVLAIVGLLGLHKLLTRVKSSLTAAVAALCGGIAFSIVSAMVIVQGTVIVRMAAEYVAAGETEKHFVATAYRGLRSIDLGLDLTWDVFLCVSLVLFGAVMIRNHLFGPLFEAAGILIGTSLLTLNIITAPAPPAEAGLIDLGPLSGLWFLAVGMRTLHLVFAEEKKLKGTGEGLNG